MVEDIQNTAATLSAINLYLDKGEFLPPLLPKAEADTIRIENREAIIRFGGHVIKTLLNPQVAELALRKEKKYDRDHNIYYDHADGVSIGFDISKGIPTLTLTKNIYTESRIFIKDRITRNLEPTDLADLNDLSICFLGGFLMKSRRFLERALYEINGQTIRQDTAEHLKRITQACLEGSALVEKAINA